MDYFFLHILFLFLELAFSVLIALVIRNYVYSKIQAREKKIEKMLHEIIGIVDIIKEYIQLLEDRSQKKINKQAGELFESQTKIISKMIKNG